MVKYHDWVRANDNKEWARPINISTISFKGKSADRSKKAPFSEFSLVEALLADTKSIRFIANTTCLNRKIKISFLLTLDEKKPRHIFIQDLEVFELEEKNLLQRNFAIFLSDEHIHEFEAVESSLFLLGRITLIHPIYDEEMRDKVKNDFWDNRKFIDLFRLAIAIYKDQQL